MSIFSLMNYDSLLDLLSVFVSSEHYGVLLFFILKDYPFECLVHCDTIYVFSELRSLLVHSVSYPFLWWIWYTEHYNTHLFS